MSPQPESRMPVSIPPLRAAVPSPGPVAWRLVPSAPGARCPQPPARRLSGDPTHASSPRAVRTSPDSALPTVLATLTDARVQAWLGAPQNRQKCAPPQLKSFLEKTLMRANPPHLASRTVPPTRLPAPPHSPVPGTATLAPRAATTTPGRSPSFDRSALEKEPQ